MSNPSDSDRHGAVLETLRAVNDAIIRGNGFKNLEETVCNRLVAGAYEGAWLLTPPLGDDEAVVRAGAGDELPTVVPEAASSTDPDGSVLENGDRSLLSVPCSHDGTIAAILVVAAPTIADDELEVLREIGATIAHGLAAIQRKNALMNEAEVELELGIRNAVDPIFDDPIADASFEFVRTIPLEDAFLQYLAVEGMDDERFEREMDTFEGVDWVRRVGGDDDRTLYETRYCDPSIVGTVAAAGGRVVDATIADEDLSLVARVPNESAVDRIISAVSERFPDAEVRARRSLLDRQTPDELRATVFERLTDRQRTVLETAYVGGYFDRPRRSTGEDLAASLDVSPSTFYQHLRAGQRKVVEILFGE